VATRTKLLDRIARFNHGRDPERLALKFEAMQKSAFAFFRGTCHLFCEDWPATSRLNDTPVVWVCGDLHIENFGTYKGDNRLVYFDIADFDESTLAPCAWDLTRLATSALILAKSHGLKRKSAIAHCDVFLDAYRAALREGKARWIERAVAQGPVKSLLQSLGSQDRGAFIASRTDRGSRGTRVRIDGEHTLEISQKDRKRIARFMADLVRNRPYSRFFRVLDVARRIAGTGALGLERYTILVEGRGGLAGHFLLDLKFAAQSALAPYVTQSQLRWKTDAERIVTLQRRMQAISPALLHPVSIGSKSYVLRELMPSEDKLDLKEWKGKPGDLAMLARDLGFLLAWSELRSGGRQGSATIDELIAFGADRKWRRSVLDYAEHYQGVASRDWKTFRAAYRDGAFRGLSKK